MILVDTNVLIDVVEDDPAWADWSQQQLEAAAQRDVVAINDVVYAELSVGFRRIEDIEAVISRAGLTVIRIPRRALFLAGKAFQRYRRAGGKRPGVLPDFFLGAHAVMADAALITRDPRRFRTYFPGVELITPSAS
jgi:predicted nucleic acid-binding protein